MWGLIGLGAASLAVMAFAWWARRRWKEVDSYYEREHKDPPVFDAGGFMGGDRGL
jgi:hypothetical protein